MTIPNFLRFGVGGSVFVAALLCWGALVLGHELWCGRLVRA